MTAKASTSIVLPDAAAVFKQLMQHIAEHDVELEYRSDSNTYFSRAGCEFECSHDDSVLSIQIHAPNAFMLYFIKEAVATQISEIDRTAGNSILWDDPAKSTRPDGTPINFHKLRLTGRREVFPGMLRLTLSGETCAALDGGLHIKLMRPAIQRNAEPTWPTVAANGTTVWPKGEDKLHVRYFTLRHVRPEAGEVDIDVVRHAGGTISDWAVSASFGAPIGVMGPADDARLPRRRGAVLLAGDETALPAIARIMEAAPKRQSGVVLIALPEGMHPDEYLPASNMKIISLVSQRFRQDCVHTAQQIVAQGQRFSYAWFGGEAKTASAMRQLFSEDPFGLSKENQISSAYWRIGRSTRADTA